MYDRWKWMCVGREERRGGREEEKGQVDCAERAWVHR